MHIFKILSVGALIFIFFGGSYSQEQTELTLKRVIDHAIKNNPSMIQALNEIEAQESTTKNRYGDLFPTLSFSGGWTRTNQITEGQTIVGGYIQNLGTTNTTTNYYTLSLRSDITLFDGLSNYENIGVSRMTENYLQYNYKKAKQDLILTLLSDYITVLKNQQIVKINIASLEDSRNQLDMIKIFVEVGKRTLSDVYKQDVVVAQNELLVEQSKNDLDKSLIDLIYDAYLPQDKSYTVGGAEFPTEVSFASLESYVQKNSSTDQLVDVALKNRYDLISSKQNVDILDASAEITRNNLIFPTLTGFSTYNLSGSKIGEIDNSRVFTIGLTLSYPIFQGFSLDNQRQQALIRYRSAKEELNLVRNRIGLEIKKSVLDLKSLLKQIEITERNLKAAEQDKFLAEESYRIGAGILLDVQTATTKYNNALIDKSNLIYNFILAQKQLEYYQGIIKY